MKKTAILLLALLLIIQVFSFPAIAESESGSPKHIPRIVSVVFDDSGSMYDNTDRWAYASYAMQAFVAMMGEEDVLHVTYLNASANNKNISLSDSSKQGEIEKIENTMFGGKTPNKLSDGANKLISEYSKRGTDAKYYLVVLADGTLDRGEGEMSNELKNIAQQTDTALGDADFQTIYFAMYDEENKDSIIFDNIPGVDGRSAKDGAEIVRVLREISADIMGRSKLNHTVSNGKLSFELKYPALSVAVFVQKQNKAFSNVSVPITLNGSGVSYDVGVYYVDCPTDIVKNTAWKPYKEKVPVNPPHGFVTLIENGNSSVAKGSYTIDFSALGINANDLIVLAEPAVKIGCKYYIGESEEPITFDELKSLVRVKDRITVEFGLYEMNSDGSMGEPIPLDVLSPDYKLYINDALVGDEIEKNTYRLTVEQEFEEKELKIEAFLEGYQPFVLRETFGKLNLAPGFDENADRYKEVDIIKPDFQGWIDGTKNIRFPLEEANNNMLNDLSIRVEGYGAIASGNCSSLGGNVWLEGNELVYAPKFDAGTGYSQLPQSILVTLVDNVGKADMASVKLKIVQPKYKFEATNGLEGVALSLGVLKTNDKKISFSLLACYDGSESYSPISNYSCEKEISLSLNKGVLTGTVNEQNGGVEFVPQYDSAVNTDVSPSDIVSRDHSVYATATVDGVSVESDRITLSVTGGSYKITVENEITEKLDLDSIKNNTQKVIFKVLADYRGDGNFGPIEEWDYGVYERLEITSGKLPGTIALEYDENNRVIGQSFTPQYDEYNNNGIVFTEVAGRTHTINCKLSGTDVFAETTVEVLAPVYEIVVQKQDFSIKDTALRKNEEGIEFVIKRDGRILNKRELEGLAPYNIVPSKTSKKFVIKTVVCEASDGTAYLKCVPFYEGLLPHYFAPHGEIELKLVLGENDASGTFDIYKDPVWILISCILLLVLGLLIYLFICWATTIRIYKGKFYVAEFTQNGSYWRYRSCSQIKAYSLKTKKLIPRQKQKVHLSLGSASVTMYPRDNPIRTSPFFEANYPVCDAKSLAESNIGIVLGVSKNIVKNIIKGDRHFKYAFSQQKVTSKKDVSVTETKMLCYRERNSLYVAFYVEHGAEAKYTDKQ